MTLLRYSKVLNTTTRLPFCSTHTFPPSGISSTRTPYHRSLARMAPSASATVSSSSIPSSIDPDSLSDFHTHIKSSTRILALLGAGLSASSGLPTFRGAGGLWRTHDAIELATPEAFDEHPGLVWQFYNYRRHMALKAKPNAAHYALAELARKADGFKTLSQNVDGLSQRAGHPRSSLHLLHGSLYDIKCTDFYCNHFEQDNFTDPIVPALYIDDDDQDPTTIEALNQRNGHGDGEEKHTSKDISDASTPLPEVSEKDLPHCPKCTKGLLRPGVVWFGEMLPEKVIRAVDDWIMESSKIDLILVIGTSCKVHPAAGYVQRARAKGARVAVVNTDGRDLPDGGLGKGDWFFEGDAAVVVPEMLRPVIGDLDLEGLQQGEKL